MKESCCSSTLPLPKKTGNTANQKSCGEKAKPDNCYSKSLEVKNQPLECCGDSCCQDTPQDASSPTLSAYVDNFQITMDRLDAILKRGQCLCRRVQEQWGFNCCDPASIPARVVTKKENVSTAGSIRETLSKEKSTAVSTATAIHPRCSFNAPRSVKNRKHEAVAKTRNQLMDVE